MAGPAPQDGLKPRRLQKQMYVRGGPTLPDISEEAQLKTRVSLKMDRGCSYALLKTTALTHKPDTSSAFNIRPQT